MLIKDVELDSGIAVKDALHIIGDMTMDKGGRVSFRVDIHAAESKPALDCFYDAFQYQGGDIKEEAVNKLKETGGYTDYLSQV